jgi:hypothetical protein
MFNDLQSIHCLGWTGDGTWLFMSLYSEERSRGLFQLRTTAAWTDKHFKRSKYRYVSMYLITNLDKLLARSECTNLSNQQSNEVHGIQPFSVGY